VPWSTSSSPWQCAPSQPTRPDRDDGPLRFPPRSEGHHRRRRAHRGRHSGPATRVSAWQRAGVDRLECSVAPHAPLAQSAEQRTLNPQVLGSSPRGRTQKGPGHRGGQGLRRSLGGVSGASSWRGTPPGIPSWYTSDLGLLGPRAVSGRGRRLGPAFRTRSGIPGRVSWHPETRPGSVDPLLHERRPAERQAPMF
jgi:hypothetical protein